MTRSTPPPSHTAKTNMEVKNAPPPPQKEIILLYNKHFCANTVCINVQSLGTLRLL